MLLTVQPLKGRGNPVKCLGQGRKSELTSHYFFFMLNVKQESYEY